MRSYHNAVKEILATTFVQRLKAILEISINLATSSRPLTSALITSILTDTIMLRGSCSSRLPPTWIHYMNYRCLFTSTSQRLSSKMRTTAYTGSGLFLQATLLFTIDPILWCLINRSQHVKIIDVTAIFDRNIQKAYTSKILKYSALSWETIRLWQLKNVAIYPLLISGTINIHARPNSHLENLRVNRIQAAV